MGVGVSILTGVAVSDGVGVSLGSADGVFISGGGAEGATGPQAGSKSSASKITITKVMEIEYMRIATKKS